MSRPPPPPDSARSPVHRPRISDERLCGALDARLDLGPNERRAVTAALAKFVELGRLPMLIRDHMMAMARARGLFALTEVKAPKKAKALGIDGGDNFSTRPGKVDPRAAAQVPWLGGRMPARIMRRAM